MNNPLKYFGIRTEFIRGDISSYNNVGGILPTTKNTFKTLAEAKKYQTILKRKYHYIPTIYFIDKKYVVVKPELDKFNAANDKMTREAGALLR